MDFYDWMKRYRGKVSPIGDLANDMEIDDDWPRFSGEPTAEDREIALRHLNDCRACDDCIDVFKKAWSRYKAFLRRQKKAEGMGKSEVGK